MSELDDVFDQLRTADVVAFGGVGFANELLPVTEAYRRARAAGDAARDRAEQLLTDGSPAGRVYAATLLGELDPAAGEQAWHRLSTDESQVTVFDGCLQAERSVRTYATTSP
ncbi:hypothetical protein [Amycolatopsis nigrescens]|uniref:hypothetical protein n=1 Tax=Amycolatopsis nigrescens TaxID=381445 RepID=UPI000363AA30|nr:hypothetical protein [Amycolatopsis nigrescens]